MNTTNLTGEDMREAAHHLAKSTKSLHALEVLLFGSMIRPLGRLNGFCLFFRGSLLLLPTASAVGRLRSRRRGVWPLRGSLLRPETRFRWR